MRNAVCNTVTNTVGNGNPDPTRPDPTYNYIWRLPSIRPVSDAGASRHAWMGQSR